MKLNLRKNIRINVKKHRRGRRNKAKNIRKSLRFMGVNSAGLRSKLPTFRKIISELKPSVFCIEETKYKEIGRLKMENYFIYELVRKNREGGGLALGCDKALKPAWVREGDDEVEALSVDIFVTNMKIRCCVAYGCQESDTIERRIYFGNT